MRVRRLAYPHMCNARKAFPVTRGIGEKQPYAHFLESAD